jgi:hypothetical protein
VREVWSFLERTMSRFLLGAALTCFLAAPALAQPADGEQILEGRKTWAQSRAWLVTDDGQRYHLPSSWRNPNRTDLAHGWLDDTRVTVRAEVSQERGTLTARVTELVNPAVREVRATVEEEGGTLFLSTADGRLEVRDEFTGPGLVRPLVGTTVDLTAFVYADGTALVRAVKARATGWHFQPVVLGTILMLPRWKRPGTEYWIHFRGSDGKSSAGLRHLDPSQLDFSAPGTAPAPAASEEPRDGIEDRLGQIGN